MKTHPHPTAGARAATDEAVERLARHEDASTPHCWAAAATSMKRAAAPALRSVSYEPRTLLLPPVPIRRDHADGFSGVGPTRTDASSTSSSSATIMGSEVFTPCPISDLSTVMVTTPSVSMCTQPLGAKGAAPGVSSWAEPNFSMKRDGR